MAIETTGTNGSPASRGSAGSTPGANIRSAVNAAQERGLGDAMDDAGDAVRQRAESGKDRAAERLESASGALHDAAEQMQRREPWLAGLIERGAEEMGRLVEALRTNDLRQLLHGVEDVARRQPLLTAGAGFAAGFAAVRAARIGLAQGSAAGSQSSGGNGGTTGGSKSPGGNNGGTARTSTAAGIREEHASEENATASSGLAGAGGSSGAAGPYATREGMEARR